MKRFTTIAALMRDLDSGRFHVWKKILAILGAIIAALVAYLLGRGLPKRSGVSGVDEHLREAGESVRRAEAANSDIGSAISTSQRVASNISEGNREASDLAKRAEEILRGANERSRKASSTGSSNHGIS